MEYEAKFYAKGCEWKPFCKTKHKCLRCQECTYPQYKWCLEHPKDRKRIDKILKTQKDTKTSGVGNE